jgi:NAD(P)-dependent dehydrogenase (short-subunit alcohol dehydrogenase family)
MLVQDQYTLITGASSGIGREAAIDLSRECKLILHGRSLERLEETRDMCRNDNHIIWCCDFGSDISISNDLTKLVERHKIEVNNFVHCAGMVSVLNARNITKVIVDKIMNVNFSSAIEITSVLLKKKVNQGQLKNIIFISSIWSKYGAKGYTLYCASKSALDSAMRALSIELSPTIRVNSILLGAVHTPMSKNSFLDNEILNNINKQYPLGIGKPDDAASLINFLLSSESRWMTGQQIVLDGGRSINMSSK